MYLFVLWLLYILCGGPLHPAHIDEFLPPESFMLVPAGFRFSLMVTVELTIWLYHSVVIGVILITLSIRIFF